MFFFSFFTFLQHLSRVYDALAFSYVSPISDELRMDAVFALTIEGSCYKNKIKIWKHIWRSKPVLFHHRHDIQFNITNNLIRCQSERYIINTFLLNSFIKNISSNLKSYWKMIVILKPDVVNCQCQFNISVITDILTMLLSIGFISR